MEKVRETQKHEIIVRTHRISQELYTRINDEANKAGNAVNSEINSLILEGLRFREAKVVIHMEEK